MAEEPLTIPLSRDELRDGIRARNATIDRLTARVDELEAVLKDATTFIDYPQRTEMV